MDNLVIGALKECRVYCYNRFEALCCKSCCKGNAMLLCNADIIKSVWKFFCKSVQACAFRHCCRYSNYFLIFSCNLYYRITENLCVRRNRTLLSCLSCLYIKWRWAVEECRVFFCKLITLALLCYNMY